MYENGKRVEGYQKKRLHKRKVKTAYAKTYCWGNSEYSWSMMVTEYKDVPRERWGHPLDYWKDFSLTGPRKYAKSQTNSTLRREFNNQCRRALLEDFDETYDYMPQVANGNYRKYFDYAWTVW